MLKTLLSPYHHTLGFLLLTAAFVGPSPHIAAEPAIEPSAVKQFTAIAGPMRAAEVMGREKPQRVEYYDTGSPASDSHIAAGKPVLLLMHGAYCDAADWAPVVPKLAQDYRLILPDALAYPVDAWALWRLLDALQIERVALIAHSAGTATCTDMYRLRPERVWAYVNADSAAVGGRAVANDLPVSMCSPEVQALHEKHDEHLAALEPSRVKDYPSRVNIARLEQFYRQRKVLEGVDNPQEIPGRTHPEAVDMAQDYAPLPDAPGKPLWFECPVLVFNAGYGKIDAGHPPHSTPGWEGGPLKANNYRFVVARNSGHWIWLDQPDLFLDETLDFLEEAEPAPVTNPYL